MMRTPLRTVAVALAACLLAAVPARAGNIQWNYNWTPVIPAADGAGKFLVQSDNGLSQVQLSNDPMVIAENNTFVPATNLLTISHTDPHSPDMFTSAAYKLQMTITDQDSGLTGSFFLTGHLDGALAQGSSNIRNTFTGPLTQSLQIGNHLYTLDFTSNENNPTPYAPPGVPGSGIAGSIAGYVTVTDAQNQSAPEPATFALAVVGLSGCGLAAWRRRRAG
jgi:hypothetical protein